MSWGTGLWIICASLVAAWFFAGIETGLISINRLRLQHLARRGVAGASVLQFFLQRPDALLGTTLVGTNIAVTVAAVVAASLAGRAWGAPGTMLADAAVTLLVLVFCEYFSKAWFQSSPVPRTLPFAKVLQYARLALLPLSAPLMALVRLFLPLRRAEAENAQPLITREEIVHLASEGKASGILTAAEHHMIHEVMQLTSKPCRQIMTPRDRIVSVPPDLPAPEVLNLAYLRDLGWLPIYDPSRKQFTGVVNVVDVLGDSAHPSRRAADYALPPQFVADYMPVDHVLPRMRVTRQPIVFVCDDRMEVIGLVTLDDVLDEIIGRL